jgi:radical SAM superfamily enzyme
MQHIDHVKKMGIICSDPDGYGFDCARKSTIEFSGCTFCTKHQNGCDRQRTVEVTMSITSY